MNYETLDYQIKDRILTITLNRPDKLNAFTVTMANELVDAFNRASDDDEVGAIIVTGAGRAFCAGMDLSVEGNVFGLDESMTPTPAELDERFEDPDMISGVRDTGGRVSLAIYACNKPVIGAINGVALARQMMLRNAAAAHPVVAHKAESLAMFYTSQGDGKEGVKAFLEKRDPQFTAKVSSDLPDVFSQ